MVTVAKGIDAPIKILSPKSSPFASPTDFAMLGLGDIIVPGLVIALCLRYDLHRYAVAYKGRNVTPRSKFGKPYFWCGVVSYILGLGVTIGVMHHFQRAQPALLYLSPACSTSFTFLSFFNQFLPALTVLQLLALFFLPLPEETSRIYGHMMNHQWRTRRSLTTPLSRHPRQLSKLAQRQRQLPKRPLAKGKQLLAKHRMPENKRDR